MPVKQTYEYKREECYYHSAASPYPRISTGTTSKLSHYRNGSTQPKWRQIIRDGGNATTALDAHVQYCKIVPGLITYQTAGSNSSVLNNTDVGIRGPYVVDPGILTTAEFTTLRNKASSIAMSQVYGRLAELQAPFQGQVFLGELDEVIKMIRNPFASTAKLLENFLKTVANNRTFQRALRERNRTSRKTTRLPNDIADAWLEFQFGFLPLIGDIIALLELAETVAERREHEIVRGYGQSISSSIIVNSNANAGTTGLVCRREEIYLNKAQNIIRCGLTREFITEVRANTTHLRNSVDDLFTVPITVWELIPFSFLVDYFVNVGDIIEAASVGKSGIAWVSNSVILTREIQFIQNCTGHNRPDLIKQILVTTPKKVTYGVRRVIRSSTLAGIPPVVFSLPGSTTRYANVLALITKFTK